MKPSRSQDGAKSEPDHVRDARPTQSAVDPKGTGFSILTPSFPLKSPSSLIFPSSLHYIVPFPKSSLHDIVPSLHRPFTTSSLHYTVLSLHDALFSSLQENSESNSGNTKCSRTRLPVEKKRRDPPQIPSNPLKSQFAKHRAF